MPVVHIRISSRADILNNLKFFFSLLNFFYFESVSLNNQQAITKIFYTNVTFSEYAEDSLIGTN